MLVRELHKLPLLVWSKKGRGSAGEIPRTDFTYATDPWFFYCFAAAQGSATVARLSIILPAERDADALEETLVSVLSHCSPDCEILVPHAGTYDDPYGMGEEIRLLDCDTRSSTCELIAAAIEQAEGELLHLLRPGCEVTSGWCDAAIESLDDDRVGSVAPVLRDDVAGNQLFGVARGCGGVRRELRGDMTNLAAIATSVVGPTSTAAFYRRDALDCIGGWPTTVSEFAADLDVGLSLREAGFLAVVAKECLVAAPSARRRPGAFRHAADQESLFWRHEASQSSRNFRPLVAALQCLSAGMPWSMAAAACGKLYARGAKEDGDAHRQRIAAAVERSAVRGEGEARPVSEDYRKAA